MAGRRRVAALLGLALAVAHPAAAEPLEANPAVADPAYRTGRVVRCKCGAGLRAVRVWPAGKQSEAVNLGVANGDPTWLAWPNHTRTVRFACDGDTEPGFVFFPQLVDYWSVQLTVERSSHCADGAALLTFSGWDQAPYPTSVPYISGESGYVCTAKIPVLLRTLSGALLAFAEARRESCSDSATTDLVVKRSEDGGRSWSPLQVVRGASTLQVVGNAAPVQLARASKAHPGRILLPHCLNNLEVWLTYSDDDGLTWAKPHKLEGMVLPSWRWVGTGPPGALQLRSGRVLVPAYHGSIRVGLLNNIVHGHVMLSDDDGDTWRLSAAQGYTQKAWLGVNENQAVELKNGSVLINGRSLATLTPQRRIQVRSDDGGETWSKPVFVDLPQPINGCQGSIVSTGVGEPPALLFSGPDSSLFRTTMRLWLSTDEGGSWHRLPVVSAGPSGYSSMQMDCEAAGAAGSRCDVLLLYEESDMSHTVPVQNPQRQVFRRIPLQLPLAALATVEAPPASTDGAAIVV